MKMKKQTFIIVGLVSILSVVGISSLVLANDFGRHCEHRGYKAWHQDHREGHWDRKDHRKGWASNSLFRLERQLEKLALSKAQRDPVYAVLDESRPVLRKLRQEMADNRRALKQLKLAAEDYLPQLNELAAKQAELKKNFIVKTGEVKSKVFALLDEQQQEQFLKKYNKCMKFAN